MPLYSPHLLVWPADPSSLRGLLGLDAGLDSFCCHGKTVAGPQCRRRVKRDKCRRVSDLLAQIVKKGSLEAAGSLLDQVSKLVFCHQHLDLERPLWLKGWMKTLRLLKSSVGVKKEEEEEEEEDVKAVLGALKDVSDRSETLAPQSTLPYKTDTTKEPLIKHEPLPSEPSTPIPTTPSRKPPCPTSPSSPSNLAAHHVFQPFGPTLTTHALNSAIQALLLRPLLPTEMLSSGHVYMYTFPDSYHSSSPHLKIGNTKDLAGRMAAWAKKCGYEPKLLADFRTDCYVRAERLVHATLANGRLVEKKGCPGCGVRHREWFRVGQAEAVNTIGLWTRWTRLRPYDEDGELKPEWVRRVEEVDLNDAKCWHDFAEVGA